MKIASYTYWLIALSFFVGACQVNPLDEVESGDWNKEKRILGLVFQNQAGDATISLGVEDPDQGTIEVTIVNPDFSQPFKIKKMELSYKATASVNKGDEIWFDPTNHSAVITVTAVSGEKREYTVRVTPLVESLIGTWDIHELDIFGGTGAYYNGVDFVNLSFDPTWWNPVTGVAAELDNSLEFIFEGITEEGQTYGTCINHAGADDKYADFTWAGGLPEGQTVIDVNYNYRKIPKGTSHWIRDYSTETVSFTKDNQKYVASLVNSGEIVYWGKKLNIVESALKFTGLKPIGNWGPMYSAYDKIVYVPWDFYIQMKKNNNE